MYVRTIGFHPPTEQVWQFVSTVEVDGQPDDVILAAIKQTADHDQQGLAQLIPDQFLPQIEWYASATRTEPEPLGT